MANLRIPGPTPIPPDILAASAKPMINHRGPEFREIIGRVTEGLKKVFETSHEVLILTTSGTGGLEAAVVNMLSPGEPVLAVSIGAFGDRFAQIAQVYGAQVTKLSFPLGSPADPDRIRQALREHPEITTVCVTHNETSTGVTNDLEAIAKVAKGEFDKLLLVDGVSSVSSIPCRADAWNLDVVISGSQKGWMAPPGLAFLSVSPRAWQAAAKAKLPRFYFDLGRAKASIEHGETPWTPAVSVFFAMDLALQKLLAEGMSQVYARHARLAQMTRDGIKALGLSLFADERYASNTVTAVKVPEGVEARKITQLLRTQYDVVLAAGQASLEDKIIRIGHMGYVTEQDIRGALDALRDALPKLGVTPAAARRA